MSLSTKLLPRAEEAVRSILADPGISIDTVRPGGEGYAVTQAARLVVDQVAPVLEHESNQEPWYQSRVTLGSIGTIVTSAFGIVALCRAGVTDGELYAAPIAAAVGAGVALYGRWRATRPIWS